MARKKGLKISRDVNVNWRNNDIQFPRLIAELEAVGAFTPEVMEALETDTGLDQGEISEIVDRAQTIWDDIKSRT